MNTTDLMRVAIDDLAIGASCRFEVRDQRGLLLLGPGQPVTDSLCDQLRDRDVDYIEVHPDDVAALTGAEPAASAPPPVKPSKYVKRDSRVSLNELRADRTRQPYSQKRIEEFNTKMDDAVNAITEVGANLQSLSPSSVDALNGVPGQLTEMLLEDADLSIHTLSKPAKEYSLARRCARMSLLAINTAIELHMSQAEVNLVGTAALYHDLGLFFLPEKFRDPTAELNSNEADLYRTHPTIAVKRLEAFDAVEDEVRLLVHQVHERPDGTGYPRKMHGRIIHPLAGMIRLIDSYLNLIEPGPDRPGIVPHDALAFILHDASRSQFPADALRAFLTQMTLFPIGSHVELNTGERAVVIRRDSGYYHTPVVRLLGEGSNVVYPLRDSVYSIARPIVENHETQMRLTHRMMQVLSMDRF